MNLIVWLRKTIVSERDPAKVALMDGIAHETERLNGATVELTAKVSDTVETRREHHQMQSMLDDTLRALSKEPKR